MKRILALIFALLLLTFTGCQVSENDDNYYSKDEDVFNSGFESTSDPYGNVGLNDNQKIDTRTRSS